MSVASGRSADHRDDYAARAVKLLRQATAVGFRNHAKWLKDTDLDPLRDRADFQAVLKGITPPELAPPPRPVK